MNRKFRTALAALIAAISVAVMVAPMASAKDALPVLPPLAGSFPQMPPMSASLSITPVSGGLRNVLVSGVLRTSTYAEADQLFHDGNRIAYTLWGEDQGEDQELYRGAQSFQYEFQVDEQGRTRVYFSLSIQLTFWTLDEDSGSAGSDGSSLAGRDEVYADVRLANSWSGVPIIHRVKTKTVYGYF